MLPYPEIMAAFIYFHVYCNSGDNSILQFGPEKDVYGPRFAKNITVTFQHIFRCTEDEKVDHHSAYF